MSCITTSPNLKQPPGAHHKVMREQVHRSDHVRYPPLRIASEGKKEGKATASTPYHPIKFIRKSCFCGRSLQAPKLVQTRGDSPCHFGSLGKVSIRKLPPKAPSTAVIQHSALRTLRSPNEPTGINRPYRLMGCMKTVRKHVPWVWC